MAAVAWLGQLVRTAIGQLRRGGVSLPQRSLVRIGSDEPSIVPHLDTAANDLRRIAGHDRTARDILGNDTTGTDHAIVAYGNARQNQAFAADETVPADPGVQVEAARAIMCHDPRVESDVAVFADMDTARKSHVGLGAERHLDRRVNIHAHRRNEEFPARAGQQLSKGGEPGKAKTHGVADPERVGDKSPRGGRVAIKAGAIQ